MEPCGEQRKIRCLLSLCYFIQEAMTVSDSRSASPARDTLRTCRLASSCCARAEQTDDLHPDKHMLVWPQLSRMQDSIHKLSSFSRGQQQCVT